MSPGTELFARYAHAPNALGYCGPSSGIGSTETEIRAGARRFSGVWPYLQVLARLTGIDDPLDARLVEAYWLGRDLGVDRERFGAELLDVIGPRAGRYWTHLTPSLLAEGAPDHAFHVFGVYPWSRLLDAGPEPLQVLDSCRISWGRIVARTPDGIEVAASRLTWEGATLELSDPAPLPVPAAQVPIPVAVGDAVALHWGRVCDVLADDQVAALEMSTARELSFTTGRIGSLRTGDNVSPGRRATIPRRLQEG